MSFQKRWDLQNIKSQIMYCGVELNSPYNDGFTGWSCKKDLYEIKFYVDNLLESSPIFSHIEENFLKEQEQNRVLNILKKE
jgi:hypothetical protein